MARALNIDADLDILLNRILAGCRRLSRPVPNYVLACGDGCVRGAPQVQDVGTSCCVVDRPLSHHGRHSRGHLRSAIDPSLLARVREAVRT